MEGTLCVPSGGQGPYPGVVLFHGMTGSQKKYVPFAEALADNGIVGLAVSIRGHGGSERTLDTTTPAEGYADALAAYDFLAEQGEVDSGRIGLFGSSFGGMLSALIAKDRATKSILLRVPAAYTEDMMRMTYQQTMDSESNMFFNIEDISACPALRSLQGYTGSLLVIAAEKDAIIPLRIPEAYVSSAASAVKKELQVDAGALHPLTDERSLQDLCARMVGWFRETL